MLWEGPNHYLVEIHSDNLANLPDYNNRNIDQEIRKENENGHFTDVLVYDINLMPREQRTIHGMVCAGTKESVTRQLKLYEGGKNEFR